jgi:tight adherence protein B
VTVAASRRSRALARIGIGATVVVAAVAIASPAYAVGGQILSATPQPDGHLSVVFAATDTTGTTAIDPTSVIVTIDGQRVPAVAKPIGSSTVAPSRRTLLVMDVSGSMTALTADGKTTRIAAAKSAARAYLTSVPKDVLVGLVTFGDAATVTVAPTTDRGAVTKAVDGLTPKGSTLLYDAVVLADTTLGSTGIRNQLLLTDGTHEGSATTLKSATSSITSSGITVDAVSLGTDKAQVAALTALTSAGKGSVIATNDAAKLAAAFTAVAQSQASQVVVDVTVPPNVAGTSKNVTVSAAAAGQTIGDSGNFILPAVAADGPIDAGAAYGPVPVAAPDAGVTTSAWFLPLAIGLLAVGLFILLAVGFVSTDKENQTAGRLRRRLSRYSLNPRTEQPVSTVATSGALGHSQVARSAVELAGRVVQRRDIDTGLGAKLEAAGLPLRSAEWALVHVGIIIVTALVFTLLSGFNLLATLIGLVLGAGVPFVYLSLKEGRRKSAFAQALPDTLQLLAGSLAAGYSLPQAVDSVVRESSGPMAAELNRALVEARLGVPMEDALETVARRMDSVDFAWVVMAIRIQREVGGNLAEVLTQVAATMRERERLRRQVQVLSAEGRLSAVVLGGLPVVFILYLVLVRPEYIGLLVTTPLGILMIIVGLVMLVVGAFWLRKVVTVEV